MAKVKSNGAKPKGKGKAKGEQQRIALDDRSVIYKTVTREIARPMSPEAFRLAAAESARAHNKIKRIEKEIYDFANGPRPGEGPEGEDLPSRKTEIKVLTERATKLDREVEAEAHLVDSECIEAHDLNRNTVTTYLALPGGERGTIVDERAMTDDERRSAESSAPFASGPIDVPDGERETVDDEEPGS